MNLFLQILFSTSYAFKTTLGAEGSRKLNIIFDPGLGILKIDFERLEKSPVTL